MKMDKFIVKGSKRKKRHTRRNLNEIRKRRLQVHNHNNNNENNLCKLKEPKVTGCITNRRLTLANKAIRSETVTRSILSELRKDKNNNIILLPNRKETLTTKVSNRNYNKEIIPFKVSSKLKSPLFNYIEKDNQKTPDSIVLFSSSENEKQENNDTINDVSLDSSSPAPTTFVMQNDNNPYNEFMTNIVNYIEESVSIYFKTDTVYKHEDPFNSKFLQNVIYITNKNIPGSQSDKNKNDVNPKLYITGHDTNISFNNPKKQTNINIQYSLEKACYSLSPIFSQSQESNLQKLLNSSSCSGQESPEYFYYPHRLNQ